MKTFNLGSLADWQPVAVGQYIEIPAGEAGYRTVTADLMVDRMAVVYATSQDMILETAGEQVFAWPVAVGIGLLQVRFAVRDAVSIWVEAVDPSCTDQLTVTVRRGQHAQVVPERDIPSFTEIKAREAGPGADLRRMMQMVQLNSQRREGLLLAEIERLTKAGKAPPVAVPPAVIAAPAEPAGA